MKNSLSYVNESKASILLAPNAFKGSLEAPIFCHILSEELESPQIHPIPLPMCDGGDGTAAILASYLQAQPVNFESYNALGSSKIVTYYTNKDTAIVDLAEVCGLKDLKPTEYDVLNANTAGLGKVLLHIARQQFSHIILGVGGSASIDGGLGALTQMGLKIVKKGHLFKNDLLEIEGFENEKLKENFKHTKLTILCDVENCIAGPTGAAFTFGPQKGATSLQVSILDQQLKYYSNLLSVYSGKEIQTLKHGGAAGGIAAAFHALLDATLVSGAKYFIEISSFQQLLPQSRLVITGEGKLDSQSLYGKLPGVISSLCREHHIPVIAIAGRTEYPLPEFDQIYTLLDYAENLPASMKQAGYYLRQVAKDLKRNILKLI